MYLRFIAQNCIIIFLIGILNCVSCSQQANENETLVASFTDHDISLQNGRTVNVYYGLAGTFENNCFITYNQTVSGVLEDIPGTIVNESNFKNISISTKSVAVGHTVIYINNYTNCSNMTDFSAAYSRVDVSHSNDLDYISYVVGWLYFVAWSISFYPQTFMNFHRKSVVGLNFDFLALNIVGFLYYSVFNIGLYWVPKIKEEYFNIHEFGVNPVQLNDVVFAVHAFFACLIQIVQCCIYERGGQRVSRPARVLLGLIAAATALVAALSAAALLSWLHFLYFISYIKLLITLIKYMPQGYSNYRRKSTAGWSIGNVLLDLTGGTLSIAQMFLLAYNYDDWSSVFGDFTKFGLGFISILFDVFFMVQHYGLYRNAGDGYVSMDVEDPEQASDRSSLLNSAPEIAGYGAVDDSTKES